VGVSDRWTVEVSRANAPVGDAGDDSSGRAPGETHPLSLSLPFGLGPRTALAAAVVVLGLVGFWALGWLLRTPVDFDAAISLQSDVVRVEGRTTLIDGSLVDCEAWHESEDDGLGPGRFITGAGDEVRDGQFECSVPVSDWPPGRIRVSVTFRPYWSEQPAEVRLAYGNEGQRLGGPAAVSIEGGRQLQVVGDVHKTAVEQH
jgi:hypothetical protein